MFTLHPQLAHDTLLLKVLTLCELRLLPDSQCAWLVLIPRKKNIKEIHQLCESDQITLIGEITSLTKKLEDAFSPDKINVGALGNMVEQLHIHLICRFTTDRAWPGPIWGVAGETDYPQEEEIKQKIMQMLELE